MKHIFNQTRPNPPESNSAEDGNDAAHGDDDPFPVPLVWLRGEELLKGVAVFTSHMHVDQMLFRQVMSILTSIKIS